MSTLQSVTFGTIVHVNPETGMLGIETRLGERLLVNASACESETAEVAVFTQNGTVYAVVSLSTWADVEDTESVSYRVQA